MQLPPYRRVVSPLMAAVAAASLLGSLPAQAFQFQFADDQVTGSLDTTLSYGALWRVTGPHKENIGTANGGTKPTANYDNGALSYKRGEMVSSLFKMTNDLDANYKNFGAFLRITSFYDRAIETKSFDQRHTSAPVIVDRVNDRVIHERLGHDYEILDAYVRAGFDIAGKATNVRVGKQVVSWGESTFIPNGINSINPVDVSKLRAPGSELKEAFLPVNMLWISQELTDNVTVEVFNQFQHKKTRLDPNGSYFSSNDFISPGGHYINIGAGTPDSGAAFVPSIRRVSDRDARNSHQYGIAARVLVPELNNTEFGLYYMNYHSRTPFVSGKTGAAPGLAGLTAPDPADRPNYLADYPEDIALFGLSFSTPGPYGVALQGEYSYRPNMPLQIAATDLLNALLTFNAGGNCAPGNPCAIGEPQPLTPNTPYSGFKRVRFHQAQLTGTKSFGPQLKADQVVTVAELGYTYMDLPDNRNGFPLAFNGTSLDHVVSNPSIGDRGAATKQSYGYRLVARADYNSVLGSINLSPRVAFAHDLRGVSPTFNQGVQAATVGLGASYQSNWQADLAYTNFFGGETYRSNVGTTTNNPLSDRDFIAATVSYSF